MWCVFAAAIVGLLAAGPAARAAELTQDEARLIAAEAYIYTYPLVLMDLTRQQMTNVEPGTVPGSGPMNTWSHFREFPDPSFRTVVRPNFDTLYSIAWLDLTKEPMIVSVPDTHGRYYLLEMLGMWTDVFAAPGKRTSGTGAGQFAVTGPEWEGDLPDGVVQLRATTPYVWVVGRTQTNGPSDYAAVHKVQDGLALTPLSNFGKEPPAIEATIDPSVDMKTPPSQQVQNMSPQDHFRYAASLMELHPPHISDGSLLLRMKRIGLEPGKSFDFASLDPELQTAVTEGVKAGQSAIHTYAPKIARIVNGWQMNIETMGVYGNSYLKRAVIAMAGLGANQQQDAVYPMNITDADGNPVLGEGRYVIHFEKDSLPPVGAFWSVTMYDKEGFPVPNAINRYAIGDRDPLEFNPDGSLDIYIQHESPGKDKESNWLPSPNSGELSPTMRLYAPKLEVLTGEWNPPGIKRIDQ